MDKQDMIKNVKDYLRAILSLQRFVCKRANKLLLDKSARGEIKKYKIIEFKSCAEGKKEVTEEILNFIIFLEKNQDLKNKSIVEKNGQKQEKNK